MHLIVPPASRPRRLGLLPGTFNPPTRAHLALAEAALDRVDEVMLVLPGFLPHKTWNGATVRERMEMLRLITGPRLRFASAVAEGGLYVEIAAEARELFPDSELYMICGRDAAERVVGWDYGDPEAILRHLELFHLVVAPRGGHYTPPASVAHAVHQLTLDSYDDFASTRIRGRAEGWENLVPDEIAALVQSIYGPDQVS